LRIYEKRTNPKSFKNKKSLAAQAALSSQEFCFWGITPKIRMLEKFMCLEASTKPHIHQKFVIFWTNISSTMACPNFKNGPKNGQRPLGVKDKIRTMCAQLQLQLISKKSKKEPPILFS
jgi:hypothetical protein